jgi:RNA polymerase sigma factor (sigma-70 family)
VDNRSDLELIAAILAGQINDFRVIISRHKNMAYSTAYSILRNKEEAEDAAQEAFIKTFNSLKAFKGNSKFSTWFFRIVYHTSLTMHVKNKHIRSALDITKHENSISHSEPNDALLVLSAGDRTRFLSEAINQMLPEDKLVILLYYMEEKTLPEIAELTGWNLSATKVRVHRARIKIQSYLNQTLLDAKKHL